MRPNRFHRFYVHERYKYEWSVVYMMWHGMYFVEKRKFFDMLIVSIIILFPSFNTLCAVSIALFDRSNLKAENSKRTREGHHDTEITQKKFHTNNNLLNILMKFVIKLRGTLHLFHLPVFCICICICKLYDLRRIKRIDGDRCDIIHVVVWCIRIAIFEIHFGLHSTQKQHSK